MSHYSERHQTTTTTERYERLSVVLLRDIAKIIDWQPQLKAAAPETRALLGRNTVITVDRFLGDQFQVIDDDTFDDILFPAATLPQYTESMVTTLDMLAGQIESAMQSDQVAKARVYHARQFMNALDNLIHNLRLAQTVSYQQPGETVKLLSHIATSIYTFWLITRGLDTTVYS